MPPIRSIEVVPLQSGFLQLLPLIVFALLSLSAPCRSYGTNNKDERLFSNRPHVQS